MVSSQNANREWVYSQQQTISAEGYSGQAFNPHFPHTTSGVGTTKNCTDCHLSKANDNNAWMTQLLGFGTGTVNFFGRYAYVGEGSEGFRRRRLDGSRTNRRPRSAAICSSIAYPDNYRTARRGESRQLQEAYRAHGKDILDLVLRGEYLYTANGPGGFEVFDVANIDQKGFSERIVTLAGFAARPAHLCPNQIRHSRRAAEHARAGSGARALAGKRGAADRACSTPTSYVTDREEGLVDGERRARWSTAIRTTIS